MKSGQRVDDLNELELRELIKYHPKCKEKTGVGIDHFMVEGPAYSKHFVIVRTDGSRIDFSYHRCYGTDKPDIHQAARYAVNESIKSFRDKKRLPDGKFLCELTGAIERYADVDHHPLGFLQILNDWKKERGLTDADIATKEPPDGIGIMFADDALASDFRQYHDTRAELHILSVVAHQEVTQRKKTSCTLPRDHWWYESNGTTLCYLCGKEYEPEA